MSIVRLMRDADEAAPWPFAVILQKFSSRPRPSSSFRAALGRAQCKRRQNGRGSSQSPLEARPKQCVRRRESDAARAI
jgi:hypothetical protein